MKSWDGLLYTITTADMATDGDSGLLTWPTAARGDVDINEWVGLPVAFTLAITPTGFAGTETADININAYYGDELHSVLFPLSLGEASRITKTNVRELLNFPHSSEVGVIHDSHVPFAFPPHFGFSWEVGNGTAAGEIKIYGTVTSGY